MKKRARKNEKDGGFKVGKAIEIGPVVVKDKDGKETACFVVRENGRFWRV